MPKDSKVVQLREIAFVQMALELQDMGKKSIYFIQKLTQHGLYSNVKYKTIKLLEKKHRKKPLGSMARQKLLRLDTKCMIHERKD